MIYSARRLATPYSLVLTVCLASLSTPGTALARQDNTSSEVKLEADSYEDTVVDGVTMVLLIGAILRQGETTVFADRLMQEGDEQYLLTGNVRIVERGDTVDADVVQYDGKTKVGHATGNVVFNDGTSWLTSNSAIYFSEEKRTEFDTGVTYSDSLTQLTSDLGTYWSDDAVALFKGSVRLRQAELFLEADSINYERDTELMIAAGNVFVDRLEGPVDSTRVGREEWVGLDGELKGFSTEVDRTQLYSDTIYYDGDVDSTSVRGDVILLRTDVQTTSIDSLMMRANQMVLLRSSDFDRVIATDSVEIIGGSFSVVGDSLVHDRTPADSTEFIDSRMFGSPRAWFNESQITSDSLQMFGSGGVLDSLYASGRLFVASRDTVIGRIQQLKGRSLHAGFENDSLRSMTVSPNAEALYYIEPNEGEPVVVVEVSADRIVFEFEDGVASNIHVITQIEGTLFPNSIVDQARNLTGFVWEPDLRPDRDALHDELLSRKRAHATRPKWEQAIRISNPR